MDQVSTDQKSDSEVDVENLDSGSEDISYCCYVKEDQKEKLAHTIKTHWNAG